MRVRVYSTMDQQVKDSIIPYVKYDQSKESISSPKTINKNIYIYPKDRVVKVDIEGEI